GVNAIAAVAAEVWQIKSRRESFAFFMGVCWTTAQAFYLVCFWKSQQREDGPHTTFSRRKVQRRLLHKIRRHSEREFLLLSVVDHHDSDLLACRFLESFFQLSS